jgi:hypothetical protein
MVLIKNLSFLKKSSPKFLEKRENPALQKAEIE